MLAPILAATLLVGSTLEPARFPVRPGWQTGHGRVHACPGGTSASCSSVTSWAATVRWRDCVECLPHRTVARLPADGIAIQLTRWHEQSPPAWIKPLRWPPRLRTMGGPFEGLPPRIGVVQLIGRVRGRETYLWVFFGRARPTARQLARAHAELAAVRFP